MQRRWRGAAGCAVVLVVLVGISGLTGRSHPAGSFRAPLAADGLRAGCYPLPDGIELDFPHQLRRDAGSDGRRELVVQYDLLTEAEVTRRLEATLRSARFEPADGPGPPTTWTRGDTRIGVRISAFEVPSDSVVRGQITFDLPDAARGSSSPVCADPASTKRFP